jgi:hypothetical protein
MRGILMAVLCLLALVGAGSVVQADCGGDAAAILLRQRFVGERRVQPIIVVQEVDPRALRAAQLRQLRGARRFQAGNVLGALNQQGNNLVDFLLLREVLRR